MAKRKEDDLKYQMEQGAYRVMEQMHKGNDAFNWNYDHDYLNDMGKVIVSMVKNDKFYQLINEYEGDPFEAVRLIVEGMLTELNYDKPLVYAVAELYKTEMINAIKPTRG